MMDEFETLCDRLSNLNLFVTFKRFDGLGSRWGAELRNGVLGHWPQGFGNTALEALKDVCNQPAVQKILEKAK